MQQAEQISMTLPGWERRGLLLAMIRVPQKGRPVTTVVVVVNLCFTSLFGAKGLLRSQQKLLLGTLSNYICMQQGRQPNFPTKLCHA